jgi:hypothetical protein
MVQNVPYFTRRYITQQYTATRTKRRCTENSTSFLINQTTDLPDLHNLLSVVESHTPDTNQPGN